MNQVTKDNFFGVILDETLSWKPHISQAASKLSKSVGVIRKLRNGKRAACNHGVMDPGLWMHARGC